MIVATSFLCQEATFILNNSSIHKILIQQAMIKCYTKIFRVPLSIVCHFKAWQDTNFPKDMKEGRLDINKNKMWKGELQQLSLLMHLHVSTSILLPLSNIDVWITKEETPYIQNEMLDERFQNH